MDLVNNIIGFISRISKILSDDKAIQTLFDREINELMHDDVEVIDVTSYYNKKLFTFIKTTTRLFVIEMNSNVKKIVSYELNSLVGIVLDIDPYNRKIFDLKLSSKGDRDNVYISLDENNTKAIKFFRDLNKELMTNKLNRLVNCDENKTQIQS